LIRFRESAEQLRPAILEKQPHFLSALQQLDFNFGHHEFFADRTCQRHNPSHWIMNYQAFVGVKSVLSTVAIFSSQGRSGDVFLSV
jgi:hypothetical protein